MIKTERLYWLILSRMLMLEERVKKKRRRSVVEDRLVEESYRNFENRMGSQSILRIIMIKMMLLTYFFGILITLKKYSILIIDKHRQNLYLKSI